MDACIVYQAPYSKRRVGALGDGGYVICDMPGSYDGFISCGIGNDVSFENEFINMYPTLECYAFDGTIDRLPPNYHKNIVFVRKNVGSCNTKNTTDLIEYIDGKSDVFLKMDIEGHEYLSIKTLIHNGMMERIKQLVLEVHTPVDIELYPDYFVGLQDIKYDDMLKMSSEIKKTHRLVHIHANNACKIHHVNNSILVPNVFECTFIRTTDNLEYNSDPIPSYLDYPNDPGQKDIVLDGYPYKLGK